MGSPTDSDRTQPPAVHVEALSAVTLVTRDLPRAMRFYRDLGFELRRGNEQSRLVSFAAGPACLNLLADADAEAPRGWGRLIFYVSDVDGLYARALALGLKPEAPPRDAEWGERYFHLQDTDGHELSFAKLLPSREP